MDTSGLSRAEDGESVLEEDRPPLSKVLMDAVEKYNQVSYLSLIYKINIDH